MTFALWKSWVICPFGAWALSPETAAWLREHPRAKIVPLGDNGFKFIKK